MAYPNYDDYAGVLFGLQIVDANGVTKARLMRSEMPIITNVVDVHQKHYDFDD